MQKHLEFLILNFKNFLALKNLGIFISKNFGIKKSSHLNAEKFLRFYVAISHGLLHFEALKVPSALPPKKRFSAAKLSATRLFGILGEEPASLSLSLAFLPRDMVFAAAIKKDLLKKALSSLPPKGIIAGVFPAWVAILAHLKKRPAPPKEGLFFVRTEEGYEGLWLEEGLPRGIIPHNPQAAERFLSLYKGTKEELSPAEGVLTTGACLVPEVFSPEEVPTFEDYPLLLRPRVSPKVFLLWLLPLLIWSGAIGLKHYDHKIEAQLSVTEKELSKVEKRYRLLEEGLKKAKAQEKLKTAIQAYLPGARPPLLKALLELTLAFPDGAWVRRFEFRAPDQIRLWGEAENSLVLLETLSKNPLFQEVKFLSTVSKNPITGRENFSIEIRLSLKGREKSPSGGA